MKVGENIGEILLEIAQTNISKGNIEYGSTVYMNALLGFTGDLTTKILKNQLVVITSDDGSEVYLSDDPELLKENSHNLFNWEQIINNRFNEIVSIRESLIDTDKSFIKICSSDILDYSIIDMMKKYFSDDQISTIGIHNIAARIIGSPDCKIYDVGSSNPTSIWERLEGRVESDAEMDYDNDIHKYYLAPSKYEKILYYTVRYNKLIRLLHAAYLNFEKIYFYLEKNGFINRISKIEYFLEGTIRILMEFADSTKGYYHPLCNAGLYEYKKKLQEDILSTCIGKEYCQNGIIRKDIMDGYDAGWLSPSGEFYGADGEASSMIHLNISEDIFNGNNIYSNQMVKDGVTIMGGKDSPDYWLEAHGWIKIHNDECYGHFIGEKDKEATKEFPYAYKPTEIQIKLICDYADKFYNKKFLTQPRILSCAEEVTTNKVRQMDDIMLHELFAH